LEFNQRAEKVVAKAESDQKGIHSFLLILLAHSTTILPEKQNGNECLERHANLDDDVDCSELLSSPSLSKPPQTPSSSCRLTCVVECGCEEEGGGDDKREGEDGGVVVAL
jgi:hypothetical protein